jgi:hypothetical protein
MALQHRRVEMRYVPENPGAWQAQEVGIKNPFWIHIEIRNLSSLFENPNFLLTSWRIYPIFLKINFLGEKGIYFKIPF